VAFTRATDGDLCIRAGAGELLVGVAALVVVEADALRAVDGEEGAEGGGGADDRANTRLALLHTINNESDNVDVRLGAIKALNRLQRLVEPSEVW